MPRVATPRTRRYFPPSIYRHTFAAERTRNPVPSSIYRERFLEKASEEESVSTPQTPDNSSPAPDNERSDDQPRIFNISEPVPESEPKMPKPRGESGGQANGRYNVEKESGLSPALYKVVQVRLQFMSVTMSLDWNERTMLRS